MVLPRTYLESNVELGYATTAHRSQGITVDTGHTVVTHGRLTRELLYVSMTRGRSGNFAYVSEGDGSDHPDVDPSLQLSSRSILGEVLAAEGAERTAHEVRDGERRKSDSLERLYAEYDYLAQIAAAQSLVQCLNGHDGGSSLELEQSSSWGAAVAAWRKAMTVSRQGAQRVLEQTLRDTAGANDPAAVLSMRLRRSLRGMPTAAPNPLDEALAISRHDLAEMVDQVRQRIRKRTDTVTMAAMTGDLEWKSSLIDSLGSGGSSGQLIRDVALFRDRWGISDSPLPLGAPPCDHEWEQRGHRERLQDAIDAAKSGLGTLPPSSTAENLTHSQQVVLTSAGWQL